MGGVAGVKRRMMDHDREGGGEGEGWSYCLLILKRDRWRNNGACAARRGAAHQRTQWGETTSFTVLKGEMVMIQNSNIHICTCSWLEFSRNAATYVSQFYNIQK